MKNVHTPVLLNEVLRALNPQPGHTYVDGTFGAGGYTKAILKHAPCTVYGIDRDPAATKRGKALEEVEKRFTIVEGNFGDLDRLLADEDVTAVDGIVFDLGVSSPQLDEAERGFSFQKDGPLDMRMSQQGPTAADLVNHAPEKKLADIIWQYGDEPKSRQIAKAIVARRKKKPFTHTLDLANVVHGVVPKRPTQKIDPATKTFQALRIEVNQELKALEKGLYAALNTLKPQGRLVVVSFHALEDGYVKKFFRHHSGRTPNPSRHMPVAKNKTTRPALTIEQTKAVKPTDIEVRDNPRARSARLRWAIRTEHPTPHHPEKEVF